ncbi:helix-turn-helix transcriptional regulator [Actinoplanes palleronii]|uniref:LuxR family transcriptional regulator n=1 Tax=Actinoplanes palleronii TaxID=113570 RepID=A0ABQ4BST7_9ACTN|nr:LuxR family transcriptional regulator [Actinoplanes palleronii]GIE73727.1 LuxR family transcriptional regulator [Actinoplanes palleronii]
MFVERQEQLAACDDALAACRAGEGRVLAITGSLASGKSTMLRALVDHAHRAGYAVVRGTGARTERELPLSLVNQFCADLPFSAERPDLAALMREVHGAALRHGHTPGRMIPDPRLGTLLATAAAALLTGAEHTPLLIAIDDLHHVDPLSLHCLLYLIRRIRHARILVAVASGDLVEPSDPQLYAELLELAAGHHLALPPLTRRGVGELLADALGERPGETLVRACTEASGGNPLLTSTLIADLRDAGGPHLDHDGQVQPGRAYTTALRRYVERCDPVLRRILAAAALFDGTPPADALTLARLAEVDTAAASRTLAALESAGLISDGRLPHASARQAVLDQLPPATVTDLHLRAARLLYEQGAAPLAVARHLLAAGRAPGWAAAALGVAVDGLLAAGDTAPAVALLRLAHDGAADDRQRAALKVDLLRAEWRGDPAAAGHRLDQLMAVARAGQLTAAGRMVVAHCLLWLGRSVEAVEVLDGITRSDTDATVRSEIRLLTAWIRFTTPGLLRDEASTSLPAGRTTEVAVSIPDSLAHTLDTLHKGPTSAGVLVAEQALQRSPLSGRTLTAIAAALTILIHADHLETASLWTERLLSQAGTHAAPSWQAQLLAIRAEIALRTGRPAEAERSAEAALAAISRQSWGPAIGYPLSTLILAHVARGRLAEAGRLLDDPVPDSMFETMWGLLFLRARGSYYLAGGRAQAALDDFTTCWDLTAGWDLDLPSIAPWRVDAAHAHLRLNQPDQARALAESQLTQLPPEPSRVRAATLRALAGTVPLGQRPSLLREAAEILRACGDRLLLAHTLADLGEAQRSLGDFHRARMTVRRAYDLAGDCQADALRARLLPDVDDVVADSSDRSDAEALGSLSDAERRVATLAAQGSTNRQIATRLCVTVSTVEQHLTKIYRKLDVARRADLLIKLGPRISNVA